MNLPTEPLEKGEHDFQVSAEGMPTAPADDHFDIYTVGTNVQYNYGVTDRISIYNKIWLDWLLTVGGDFASGASFAVDFTTPLKNENNYLHFIPRIGISQTSWDFAFGAQVSTIFQRSFSDKFSLYGGVGSGIGMSADTDFGWAITGNLGLNYGKKVRLSLECNPQFERELRQNSEFIFVLAPQIGIGFNFGK